MQQKPNADAQGQTPTGENGATSDPLAALKQQIDGLDHNITELQDQIEAMEASLKTASAEIERARSHKKELDTRKASLNRLVDGYQSDQQKIAQQRQAAEKDAQVIQQQLHEIRKGLEQELSDDYRQEIDQAIKEVDDRIAALTDARDQKRDEVNQAEGDLSDAKVAAAQADAALRQAQIDLRALPGMLQALTTAVKKSQGGLQKANDSGQATEAYLLNRELELALQNLGRHLDPGHEQTLAQNVQDAWTAFERARDAVSAAEADVNQAKAELEQIQVELKDYTENRRAKIEAKFDEANAGPSPNGAPPAAGRVERA